MKSFETPFETPAEFFAAVVMAGWGHPKDVRLAYQIVSGAAEATGVDGGFLVPDTIAARLWERVYDTGQLLAACDRQPLTVGNALTIPAIGETSRADGQRQGALRLHWVEEGETVDPSRPKCREISLSLKKLLGVAYATSELLQDAPALAAVLERAFALEASFEVEDGIIAGTGAGQPLGILKAGATIEVEPSTITSPELSATDAVEMYARLWAPSRRRAKWLINPQLETSLFSFGGAAFEGVPLFSWSADGTPLLLGRPVLPHESCSAVGQKGDLILADPSQYLIAGRSPDLVSSIHVRFLEDEGVFRFRWWTDGQPAWATPVTPKNGTETVSPFVVLGARA